MWLYLLIEEQRIGSLYSYDLLNTQYDKEVGRLARSNSIFYIIYKKIFRRSNSSFIPINSFMSLPKLNQPNHMCPSDSVLQKVVRTQYVTSHTPRSLVQIHHAVTSPRPWLSWSFRSIGSLHLAALLHSKSSTIDFHIDPTVPVNSQRHKVVYSCSIGPVKGMYLQCSHLRIGCFMTSYSHSSMNILYLLSISNDRIHEWEF